MGPFDLHVLSTPPAFILSQDQTLMLKFDLAPVKLANLSAIFITDLLLKVCLFFSNMFSEQFFFRIFRVALLFICQGSQLCKLLFACPRL